MERHQESNQTHFRANPRKTHHVTLKKETEEDEQDDLKEESKVYLSLGNMYFEHLNPYLSKYITSIKENIRSTDEKKVTMKKSVSRVFSMMKKTKTNYF